MKDLYQRLNLQPYADKDAVSRALESAGPQLRGEAEFILLDPKRREVYDRNHRLLRTIGQLRMHLGLNYTRFWARHEYKDFTSEPMPVEKPRGRRVNSMMIANAIARVGRVGRHGRRQMAGRRNWAIVVAVGVLLAGLALVVWHLKR